MLHILPILTLMLGLSSPCAKADEIGGEAFYRERIALPPTAVFEAILEDVSLADAPARILGRTEIRPAGQPPFAFALTYDASEIRPGHRYNIRARVLVDGALWFTSDRAHPVLTGEAQGPLRIPMRLVRGTHRDPLPRLPATYRATFSGPDGGPRPVQLDLWPDGVFHLRKERDDIGRWALEGEGLVLRGRAEAPVVLIIPQPGHLRWLDPDHGPGSPDLVAEPLDPFSPALSVQGLLGLEDGVLRFSPCLTGRSYAITGGAGLPDLRAAQAQAGPSETVASIVGRIDPGAETVSVERLIGLRPARSCETGLTDVPLRNTYWKILQLGEQEIGVADGAREPNLRLGSDGRFSATVGCNMVSGEFETAGAELSFRAGAATLKACPPPLNAWESSLIKALARTAQWLVTGETLELLDAGDTRTGLLRAVHFD